MHTSHCSINPLTQITDLATGLAAFHPVPETPVAALNQPLTIRFETYSNNLAKLRPNRSYTVYIRSHTPTPIFRSVSNRISLVTSTRKRASELYRRVPLLEEPIFVVIVSL